MTASTLALTTAKTGDSYLKFQLAPQSPAVLPMNYIQEAMVLPARRLTLMPNVPAPLMGLMNWRSRVIWAVDLAQLLGLTRFDPTSTQQYTLILIQVGSMPLGLTVQQVDGMTRLEAASVQPPIGQVSVALTPCLAGCVLQQQTQEMLLVLDAEAILQRSRSANAQSPVFQTRN